MFKINILIIAEVANMFLSVLLASYYYIFCNVYISSITDHAMEFLNATAYYDSFQFLLHYLTMELQRG